MGAKETDAQGFSDVAYLRKVTLFGVALSTSTVFASIIVIPLLFSYVRYNHSMLQSDAEFCRHKTNLLWDEYAWVS